MPFGDDRAIKLVLDAFEDIGVDRIVLNGDVLDFLNLSLHGPKNPDIQENLEYEIQSGVDFISNLRKRFPKEEIIFNAGNHESRLDRFIINKVPHFWNILKVEKILMLEQNNVIFHEYNSRIQLEETNLYFQHSPPSYSSARAAYLKKLDQSSIYGCSHRCERYTTTGASGAVYETVFNGHLVDAKKHHNVFSYMKGHEQWQQCVTLVAIKNKKQFHLEQSVIRDYALKLGGNLYEG